MENRPSEVGQVSRQLQTLRSQLEIDYERINKLRDRKNELLAKMSELQEASINAKLARDEKNKIIAEKKAQRDKLHQARAELAEKINALIEKKRAVVSSVKEPEEELVRQLKEITWKYQTTTLSIEEDRKAVQTIASLEKKLAFFKKTKDIDQEIRNLKSQSNELRQKANDLHKEILQLAEESKSFHERLLSAHEEGSVYAEELNSIRSEMTAIWEHIQQSKVQLSDARLKFDIAKTAAMQQKAAQLAEQVKLTISKRAELASRASEKLKRGERLTFEEYGALLEEKAGSEGN
uniref:Phosphoserine phosphatase n=1 Tax=Candidatus Methanomethylicus mesodigestus TaxID=1867258 RepID=A0A7C3ET01_9CREN